MKALQAMLQTPAAMRLIALSIFFTTGALSLAICYVLRSIISIYFA